MKRYDDDDYDDRYDEDIRTGGSSKIANKKRKHKDKSLNSHRRRGRGRNAWKKEI